MALSDLDKSMKAFEERNTSMDYYILMSAEGIPFKSSLADNTQVVKIAGLLFDFIIYAKRTFDDLKKPSSNDNKNMTIRMRLKNGEEYIVIQEGDLYLICKQICKVTEAPAEPEKKS